MIGFFRAFIVIPVLLLFLLMPSSVASAQQNLVVNPGFESGNTGFYTDYVHNTGQWVEAGHYEIDNTTSGYAGGVGWPMPSDSHGQFMIVNGFGGNNNQTKVVWQQTIPVSTQTTYTISYRVVNLNRVILGQSVRAKLRVKINDNYVGQQNDLPSNNNWQDWSASWQSGNNAQAVIKIYVQRLKAFASGLREQKIKSYSPGSLIMLISCRPPGVSIILTPFSSSSRRAIA